MSSHFPSHPEGLNTQVAYHVIPDTIHGGWNVYATHIPQEPQQHFDTKEEAIAYAERQGLAEKVGFRVEESEAPERI